MGGAGSKSKLPKEDMDFLIENTNFTKPQIKQWYKGFMVRRCRVQSKTAASALLTLGAGTSATY